jgi:hypothetical protein
MVHGETTVSYGRVASIPTPNFTQSRRNAVFPQIGLRHRKAPLHRGQSVLVRHHPIRALFSCPYMLTMLTDPPN